MGDLGACCSFLPRRITGCTTPRLAQSVQDSRTFGWFSRAFSTTLGHNRSAGGAARSPGKNNYKLLNILMELVMLPGRIRG
ncbi:unnamed protein product [Urochloa humidicola]